MLQDCGQQLRVAPMGGVIGLDFGAVLAFAAARGCAIPLLTDVLPAIEDAVVAGHAPAEDRPEEGEDDDGAA